jgi:hypothetical protein
VIGLTPRRAAVGAAGSAGQGSPYNRSARTRRRVIPDRSSTGHVAAPAGA